MPPILLHQQPDQPIAVPRPASKQPLAVRLFPPARTAARSNRPVRVRSPQRGGVTNRFFDCAASGSKENRLLIPFVPRCEILLTNELCSCGPVPMPVWGCQCGMAELPIPVFGRQHSLLAGQLQAWNAICPQSNQPRFVSKRQTTGRTRPSRDVPCPGASDCGGRYWPLDQARYRRSCRPYHALRARTAACRYR